VTIAKPPKRDRHLSFSPDVDDILTALAEEDAAAEGLGGEGNRSATVARLALAERARRAACGGRHGAPKGGPGPRKAGQR